MTRLHGIDISFWQGTYTPAANPPKPVDFVIVKFSEGYAQDSRADTLWTGARKADSAEGYHYWRTAATLSQQYDSFMRTADGKKVDAAWLDWEGYNNSLTKGQYELAYQWVEKMRAHFPKVGLYTNTALFEQMNLWGAWHKTVPLWFARYPMITAAFDPFTAEPTLPKGCEKWDTWQYGICRTYGNPDDGRKYGVQSATLDVNVRQPSAPIGETEPTDAEKLAILWEWYRGQA